MSFQFINVFRQETSLKMMVRFKGNGQEIIVPAHHMTLGAEPSDYGHNIPSKALHHARKAIKNFIN